jgi:hypothetical protein
MANRKISELIAANMVTPADLFVLEQSGTAKKLTGKILENWLLSLANRYTGSDGNVYYSGLSTMAVNLLITILREGVYNSDQSANITALAAELANTEPEEPDEPVVPDEPETILTRISATYSGGNVAVGTAVTTLKGIVVTAHYSNGTSKSVTGYTLSGTIAGGSNTVTVRYGGMTTTIIVTGIAEKDLIYALSEPKTFAGTNYFDTGVKLCAENTDFTIELEYTPATGNGSTAGVLHCTRESNPYPGVSYGITQGNYAAGSSIGLTNADTETRRIVMVKDATAGTLTTYCSNGNTTVKDNTNNRITMTFDQTMWLGAKQNTNGSVISGSYWKGTVSHLMIYNRQLNDNEINEFLEVETDSEEVSLNSISATYNGGDVVVGTAVTALTGIVVIAHYSDGSTETVTGYTLSGTIAEGSNIVTVRYGSKTTTIIVTGIAASGGQEPPEEEGVLYALSEPVTFDGTSYVDTGLKLCAENKDVTIELEYTGDANNSNDAGVLHCTVESTPWHGIAYGIGSGNYTAGSSIGLTKTDTETRRIVIVKDSVNGTIITYCSNGNTVEKANTSNRNTMTHEQSMWLGAKQATNGGVFNNSYWKGTISHLKVCDGMYDADKINEFLGVEVA